MNIHEHQAKEILKKYGATVPDGVYALTVQDLVEKAKYLKTEKFVLKAQIHAGGRGKAGGVKILDTVEDLAVAVVAGVIINALVFAWKSASRIRAIERQSRTEKGAKVYEIEGPLFFSSTNSFLEIFKPSEDPNLVIIDFANSKVIDQSALKAIEDIAERYSKLGKQVKLRHLTKDCHSLLRKTGQLIVDSDDDPDYGIAVDYSVKLGIFGK